MFEKINEYPPNNGIKYAKENRGGRDRFIEEYSVKKRIIMLIIAAAMGVFISACGNSREQDKDSKADIKVESSQAEELESEGGSEAELETTDEVIDEPKSENIPEDKDWTENSDPEQSFEVDLGEDGKVML